VDIGSISTKGVLLDGEKNIVASAYFYTEGEPINAVRSLLQDLHKQVGNQMKAITSIGTTGSARRLIGSMLGANCVKNEITAHAVGAKLLQPSVKTLIEIGGQDAKIILLEHGIVTDYAMNTLCAAGTGAFLSSQAGRLGIAVEDMGTIARAAQNPARIAARCTVFAESDLIHKAQIGHTKADLVAGLCHAVMENYMSNVAKGKKITAPILFGGGVSKNSAVAAAFERELGETIHIDPNSHLMGAIGIAEIAMQAGHASFSLSTLDKKHKTKAEPCLGCSNHCEIVYFYRDDEIIDHWGNRCERVSLKEVLAV